jgi:hypothetical protein
MLLTWSNLNRAPTAFISFDRLAKSAVTESTNESQIRKEFVLNRTHVLRHPSHPGWKHERFSSLLWSLTNQTHAIHMDTRFHNYASSSKSFCQVTSRQWRKSVHWPIFWYPGVFSSRLQPWKWKLEKCSRFPTLISTNHVFHILPCPSLGFLLIVQEAKWHISCDNVCRMRSRCNIQVSSTTPITLDG